MDFFPGIPVMDSRELSRLNQPKRLGPEQDPNRLVKCTVRGVDNVYSWMYHGAPVVNDQLIELPWHMAMDYARVGKVTLL